MAFFLDGAELFEVLMWQNWTSGRLSTSGDFRIQLFATGLCGNFQLLTFF